MPSPERVQAALAPPVQQVLGRLHAARELLAQVAVAGSLIRKLEYASRADRELAAVESMLRDGATYRLV